MSSKAHLVAHATSMVRHNRRPQWFIAAVTLAITTPAASTWADVSVQFDAAQTVACRPLLSPEFEADHPGERLWEAKLEVSSLISGNEQALQHFFYQVDIMDRSLMFVDYLPKTTLHSQYADAVHVENKDERTRNVGVAVTWDTLVKVTPNASVGSKKSTHVQYSLLPPKEQVAASGTQRRGRGVYYKLRPSSQHTLEGAKEFALVFRAPADWRAGTLLLRCQAKSTKKSFFRNETIRAGEGLFMLALHHAGDEQAKAVAEQYADAAFRLRQLSHQHRAEITRQQTSPPHFPLTEAEPARVPVGWLERLLVTPGDGNWPHYADHLPSEVREAGEAFLVAKQTVASMGAQLVSAP